MNTAYFAHGLTLTLGWFLAINLVLGAAAAAVAAALPPRSDARGPRFWIALRLMPAILSGLFVFALFVPSYWQYEPRESVEGFDLTLAVVAAIGAAVIGIAAVRGFAAWRSASQRVRSWMRHATPMTIAGAPLPAYAVDADQPVIALVGVVRPRLLVTRGLIETLTP